MAVKANCGGILVDNSTIVVDATTTSKGVVLQSEAQEDSVATTASEIATDFNALLAKLRTAGILAV